MNACTLWSRDIKLVAQPSSASRSRDFVRHHLIEHGLSHLSDDVALVVSELATNAMEHAQTPFKVSLHAFEQTLLLEVEDGSRTGPFHVAAQVLDTNGRGITIVKLLSRDWGVDARTDGGKSVWAEFNTRRESAPSSGLPAAKRPSPTPA
jgi:anti-sigma regulatory factor (Ser/Thr protein kinase)